MGALELPCDSLVTVHIARALRLLCSALRVTLSLMRALIIYCVTLNICCEFFVQFAVSLLRGCGFHVCC